MNGGRIAAIVRRQLYEMRRNPSQITNMVYWPVINIAVWGFFTIYLAHGGHLKPGLLNASV